MTVAVGPEEVEISLKTELRTWNSIGSLTIEYGDK